MKKFLTLVLSLYLTGTFLYSQNTVNKDNLKKHLSFLASDRLKGRLPGTNGDTLTVRYIKEKLKKYGYKPFFVTDLFPFEYAGMRYSDTLSTLSINGKSLKYNDEFIVAPFSSSAFLEDKEVINGFPADTDPSYAEDKIMLIDAGMSDLRNEIVKYSGVKVSALLFYSSSRNLSDFGKIDITGQLSIPVAFVTYSVASGILSGKSNRITAEFKLYTPRVRSNDVVMVLKAKNPVGTIMIGAHHDHLGMGEYSSRTPDRKEVHNGADDNASGVSSMLEIARLFSLNKKGLRYNIIAAAFGAEEKGLIGSKHLADSLKKLDKLPVLMVNLDMVGRMADDKVQVGGVGTFSGADSLVKSKSSRYGFKVATTKGGSGASDHSSFYSAGVPVLFLTTGVHQQYHTPDDDENLINYDGMAGLCSYVYDIMSEFAYKDEKPVFQKVKGEEEQGRATFKVSLGVVPDFTYEEGDGFRIGAVSAGRPAEKAGLKAGDIIVLMNGKEVKNIYEYMARLNELKAGQKVEVNVRREGKILKYIIEL